MSDIHLVPTLLSYSIRRALDVDIDYVESYILGRYARLDEMRWLATLRASPGMASGIASGPAGGE